jgi:hypothetical protein
LRHCKVLAFFSRIGIRYAKYKYGTATMVLKKRKRSEEEVVLPSSEPVAMKK